MLRSDDSAESLTFFALGCQIISEGYTINNYGAVISPSPSPEGSPGRRRRTVGLRR